MTKNSDYKDKVVLVTGAASGIGRAATIEFAARGALVVAADMDAVNGAETVRLVEKKGGTAVFEHINIAIENEVEHLIEQIGEEYHRLDAAFNNAGIFGKAHPLVSFPKEDWDQVIAVNLTGPFLCMKHELRFMLRQGHGAIVNTSSVGGLTGPSTMGAYAASKWGLIGLTKVAAMEHARFGIRVNAIAPGFTDTPMNSKDGAREVPGFEAEAIASTPINRAADPLEIARAAVWLCSEEASFVLGQVIPVDGGYSAGGSVQQNNPLGEPNDKGMIS